MGDYRDDEQRWHDGERRRDQDRQFESNKRILANRYGYSIDKVITRLQSSEWKEIERDGETISTLEVAGAPEGLTDPEYAAWAVQILKDKGLL